VTAPARHIESFPIRAFAAGIDERNRRILELLDRPRTNAELTAASSTCGGLAYAPGVLDHWEGQMIRKRRAPRAAKASPQDRARGG